MPSLNSISYLYLNMHGLCYNILNDIVIQKNNQEDARNADF